MRTSLFLTGAAAVLAVAAWLRFADLGAKPIHADESVHAWKVGELLEGGHYRYDPEEYHGPTLHYLAAATAFAAGERSRATLTIGTLRIVPAVAGWLVVLLTLCLAPLLGRPAALLAAAFAACSPLLVYYSRHFIQEPLLLLFTIAAIVGAALWLHRGSRRWAAAAGIAAGLVIATKETWVLVIAAAAPALFVAVAAWRRPAWTILRAATFWQGLGILVAMTVVVTIGLYSAFFTDLGAFVDFGRGLLIGAGRSAGGVHDKPWHAYAAPLLWASAGGRTWTEASIAVFALAALPVALRSARADPAERRSARFFGAFTLLLAGAYSMIPYKIVWLACGFWHGAAILAGIGAAHLVSARQSHALRLAAGALLAAALAHLGWQAWRASLPLAAHPRNPYAYVTTSPDILRLPARLRALERAGDGAGGRAMVIAVGMEEYWPLPWVLREFPHTGFWFSTPDDWRADVFLVSPEVFETMPEALRESVATEFFGLRDGALVILAAERGRWERSLAAPPP